MNLLPRIQFSTRTFLLVVLVLTIALGITGNELVTRRRHLAAERSTVEAGGTVGYTDSPLIELFDIPTERESPLRSTLRRMFGERYFGRLRSVFFGENTQEADVRAVAELATVQQVFFRSCFVTPQMIDLVSDMQNVRVIGFTRCRMDDLTAILGIVSPKIQCVQFAPETDMSLIRVVQFASSNLRVASFGAAQINTSDLIEFLAKTRLKQLSLESCRVTNADLMPEASSMTLETIMLDRVVFLPPGFVRRFDWGASFPSLNNLSIMNSNLEIDTSDLDKLRKNLKSVFVGSQELSVR